MAASKSQVGGRLKRRPGVGQPCPRLPMALMRSLASRINFRTEALSALASLVKRTVCPIDSWRRPLTCPGYFISNPALA
jgi:hypothetical protein